MTKPAVKHPLRKAALLALLVAAPAPLSMQGCTDLTEEPQSAITPENFYKNDTEVLGGLASVYGQMKYTVDEYYNVSEVSSDEIVVPTRGINWADNGKWIDLHRQTFSPNSPSGTDNINSAWNTLFIGVARANVVLTALDAATVANKQSLIAELRTLRALYYYMLMDLFGGVPIATTTEVKARPRATRAETFAFIESELKAARLDLPVTRPAAEYGRMTRGGADAILANMYLNAEVFTGTVTAAGLTKGTPRWQDAANFADSVLNSAAGYTLNANWRQNFTADNYTSPENILVVNFTANTDLGFNYPMRVLHYAQFTPEPWNGFSAVAETYQAFDAADQRRQIFLVGPQNNQDTQQPAYIDAAKTRRLIFDPVIADITAAPDTAGARILKWPTDPAHVAQQNGNDFAWFRLGEIYLIKAEALNELNRTPEAVVLVNTLRARVFSPPKPIAAATAAALRPLIYQERLFELTAEGKRRQDMIRFGTYTAARGNLKPNAAPPYKILMPIPQNQLQTNPLLKQNPGYAGA